MEIPLTEISDIKSVKKYLTANAGKPTRFRQRLVHKGELLEDGDVVARLDPPEVELTLLPFNEEVSENDRLVKAVARGENAIEIARLLDIPQHPDWRDPVSGDTAILRACSSGHVDTVRLLLEARANCNLTNLERDSPLIGAASMGSFMLVSWLLNAEADVDHRNNEGLCASDVANQRKGEEHQKIVRRLYKEEEKRDREGRRRPAS